MTKGEAVNWLINITADIGKAEHQGLWHYEQALSEIKGMLESGYPEPQWIPVSPETLPDKGRVVVVCGEKGTWDYGTYRGHGDDIHFWHWKKNTYKLVYWWMYKEDALPMPYEEDEQE